MPGNSKCQSMSVVCSKYDAIRSSALQNCKCRAGFHEDEALNKCMPDGPSPAELEKQRQAAETANQAEIERQRQASAVAKAEDEKQAETSRLIEIENQKQTETEKTPQIKEEINPPEGKATNSIETQIAPEQENTEQKIVEEISTEIVQEEVIKKMDEIMEEIYKEQAPEVQKIIKEQTSKLQKTTEETFEPTFDLYEKFDVDEEISLMKEPLQKSLELLQPKEKSIIEEQVIAFIDFEEDTTEVLIQKKGVIEIMKEAFVEKEYTKKKRDRDQEKQEAIKNNKLKEGKNTNDFIRKKKVEEQIKLQIAAVEKGLRMNHMRVLEATKVVPFDNQPKEYREYRKSSIVSTADYDESRNATSFNNSSANIHAFSDQLQALKKTYKVEYEQDREQEWIDVSESPSKVKERIDVEENIFLLFEKKIKE